MERGSDLHSPRIDEELDQETEGLQRGRPSESRVEDVRKVEDSESADRADEEPAGDEGSDS